MMRFTYIVYYIHVYICNWVEITSKLYHQSNQLLKCKTVPYLVLYNAHTYIVCTHNLCTGLSILQYWFKQPNFWLHYSIKSTKWTKENPKYEVQMMRFTYIVYYIHVYICNWVEITSKKVEIIFLNQIRREAKHLPPGSSFIFPKKMSFKVIIWAVFLVLSSHFPYLIFFSFPKFWAKKWNRPTLFGKSVFIQDVPVLLIF
jgi:hypothetical protein